MKSNTTTTNQLLNDDFFYTREQARPFFGNCSIATLVRLEKEGVLKPIRRNKRSTTAQVLYSGRNIRAAQYG